MHLKSIHPSPIAKKIRKELSIHNDIRFDDYYWLNDRENQDVIDYLNEENEYVSNVLEPLKDFQNSLFEEMKGRVKETDMSVPYLSDGWYFYARYEEGQEYPIYCRKEGSLEAPEEILLNVNELARGYEYFNVTGMSLSPNKKILAYGVDTLSRRIYTIHFKNLETGENYPFTIENTTGSSAWANDNKTLFYTVKDETLRSFQIWKYSFGNNVSSASLVFQEDDETFNCFVYKSKSKRFIFIGSSSTLSSEYRFIDANTPDDEFKCIHPRENKHEYGVGHIGNKFYIHTNWKAKNFRLMVADVDYPEKENWKEIIAHREDVLLEDIELFNDFLVLEERIEGLTSVRVINQKTDEEHYINFGEKAYTAYASTNLEFDSKLLRLSYTSLTTPSSVYDYDMESREFKLLKQQEVLGTFHKKDYLSERLNIKVRDGVEVPVSIVYHKEIKIDGSAPLLLYGYGSYGHNIDPYFSSVRLSLLDRGFVFAIAHIRGSETLGRSWYEDGKMLKKKNTFHDFIDCGKWLIKNNYSNANHLYAMGGSAGGLLMGAIANMEPNMWNGVVAQVPFVDVVTTMLDESIPLTTGEFDEWGNPKDKEYYDYIKSYSPYDNVEAKDYPNILVTTGLHDSQVQYWEPAKWVAKLRELKTDDNVLLIKTQMDYGHSGASGRFEGLKEVALEYSFILDLAGKVK
ncbi:MAG: oligopeptidase B [Crocinitomicaceae bacterium]|nr:oligopeptidase B [Crocinitomicaceae bacterium]|tara:strand:- start:22324 stop:24381 length:2058 start_codon:yes stop_codon:yes gene_type:complete